VEYQLATIRGKYDLREDDQRVKFIAEVAEFLSTLGSPVQREVYGHRAAEEAKISYDAMKLEVNKAFKRRLAKERKKQEKISLAPAQALQPKSRSIRYDNMKSAMAEETVLAMVLKDPALLDAARSLQVEEFSSPLLGKVYAQLRRRHEQGLDVSMAVLEDLSGEEMSHITGIYQRQTGPVSEEALGDCIHIIQSEHRISKVSTEDDLLALRKALQEKKGINT
jgi:DNA primase